MTSTQKVEVGAEDNRETAEKWQGHVMLSAQSPPWKRSVEAV